MLLQVVHRVIELAELMEGVVQHGLLIFRIIFIMIECSFVLGPRVVAAECYWVNCFEQILKLGRILVNNLSVVSIEKILL